MKIFLTGATGFVGTALFPRLLERGHEVSGLVRYVSSRDAKTVEKIFPNVKIYWGDLNDFYSLENALKEAQPDVILNLASQSSVEYSFSHIHEIYSADFLGTVNLALAAKERVPNLKKFIHASTMEAYGNQTKFPLTEDMRPNPASPYAIAKVADEYHLRYMHRAFGFPVVITRCANMHGRVGNTNFVVERIITELLAKHEEIKMGIPDSVRDFLYIDDGVDFYIKLIESEKDLSGEIINAGTNQPISIRELFNTLYSLIGIHLLRIQSVNVLWNSFSPRPFEVAKLTMDITKAKHLLDWEPKMGLMEGLKKTVELWRKVL